MTSKADLDTMNEEHNGQSGYKANHYRLYGPDERLLAECACNVPREQKHHIVQVGNLAVNARASAGKVAHDFKALGHSDVKTLNGELETFDLPERHGSAYVADIIMESDEVTAVCPVTSQPDWYTVRIAFTPNSKGIESKSLKLYLQSYRQVGIMCEALAHRICEDIAHAVEPVDVRVLVTQKSRGGITIKAEAYWNENL